MEPWPIIREITQPTRGRSKFSVAQVADRMGVSPSLVYKWGEPDGVPLPSEKIGLFTKSTEDTLLISRICEDSGGAFVGDPIDPAKPEHVSDILSAFSEFLSELGNNMSVVRADKLSRLREYGRHIIELIHGVIRESERVHPARCQTLRECEGCRKCS